MGSVEKRVIIDTNVFLSMFLWTRGETFNKLYNLWRRRKFEVFVSDSLFSEVAKKLEKLSDQPKEVQLWWLKQIAQNVTFVEPKAKVKICRDPKDNMAIEAALAAKAQHIISGDKDLLTLKKYKGIIILSPFNFLQKF